jgi:hypothetical protein
LQRTDIWRGGEHSLRDRRHLIDPALPSGCADLDAQLPGGGWPLGALTELLTTGAGGLQLLLPALARLSRENRWLVWIAPPYLPYAPALAHAGLRLSRLLLIEPPGAKDGLWAMEQALRSGACGAVLGWPPAPDHRALRRLQLAAEAGHAMAVVYRPPCVAAQTSPAALRLRLEAAADGVHVNILKRRGGWSTRPVFVAGNHAVA